MRSMVEGRRRSARLASPEHAAGAPAERAAGAPPPLRGPPPPRVRNWIYPAATASISTSQPASNSPVTITVSAVCRPPSRLSRTSRFSSA